MAEHLNFVAKFHWMPKYGRCSALRKRIDQDLGGTGIDSHYGPAAPGICERLQGTVLDPCERRWPGAAHLHNCGYSVNKPRRSIFKDHHKF
jgi:hypothetical protein